MTIPEEPGAYLDKDGDLWIHTTGGEWVDCLGQRPSYISEEAERTLQRNAPFTPVPRGLAHQVVYRVINEDDNFQSIEYGLEEEAKLWCTVDGDKVQTRLNIETQWATLEDKKEEKTNEQ